MKHGAAARRRIPAIPLLKNAALLIGAAVVCACSNAAVVPFDQALQTGRVPTDTDAARYSVHEKKILQNSEPYEIVTDDSLRVFLINDPIVVAQKHESQYDEGGSKSDPVKRQIPVAHNQFRVTSYMVVPVYNAEIWATLSGYPHAFRIMTIRELPALAQNIYDIPFSLREGEYLSDGGGLVHIPHIPDLQRDMVRIEIRCSDPAYQKLRALKTNWRIGFLRIDNGSSWKRMNAPHAREWIAIISNLAYTFSSPEFDVLMDHYKALTGDYFIYQKGATPQENVYFHTDTDVNKVAGTENERKRLYDMIFFSKENPKDLRLGRLDSKEGYVGLGGGSVLGIATYAFFNHYKGGSAVTVHELGHCIGFGHGSSFCYGTLESYAPSLTAMFIRLGKAPYPDPDIVGYYKPENDWARWLDFGDGKGPVANNSESLRGWGGVRNDGLNKFERFIYNNPKYFSAETYLLLKPWFDLNIDEPPVDSGLDPADEGQQGDALP